jgi:hypothetical protein
MMNEMDFIRYRSLALEFDRCKPWIAAALEYAGGTHDIEHIREAVLRGDLQLWAGNGSAIVTEIENYPRMRVLNFFLAGGNLEELELMTPGIEQWAKEKWGCSAAKLAGRQGWQRTFLRDRGYKPHYVVMTREL